MICVLHSIVKSVTDECFPWRTRKIRSTDDPWIDDEIRRAIRTRRRRFKKARRSRKWREAKEVTKELIRTAKKKYYENAVDKLKRQRSGTIPYRILKELAIPDRPKAWSVNSLAPEKTDMELAEDLADFFVKITDEFDPLTDAPRPALINNHEIAEKLRQDKKPKSAVEGDLLPSLTNKFSDILAIPATRIINHALSTLTWPQS